MYVVDWSKLISAMYINNQFLFCIDLDEKFANHNFDIYIYQGNKLNICKYNNGDQLVANNNAYLKTTYVLFLMPWTMVMLLIK